MRVLFPVLVLVSLIFWQFGDFGTNAPPTDDAAASGPAYAGLPRAPDALAVTVLTNTGFKVGYSERRRDPLWVVFRLHRVPGGRLPPRPRFERDARSRAGVSYYDLSGSDYDRGHMAPNYSIAKLYGANAQQQTFLMTNITPQRPRLNQLLWQRLEEAEIDRMAPRWQELWVTTGPVFDAQRERLSSGVEIPDAFYRLWLDISDTGEPRVLALLVPQDVRGDEPLSSFLTTVDHIEELTGLDFYSDLPQAQQDSLESAPASLADWDFDRIDCTPARYSKGWQDKDGIHLNFDRCR